ncbi:PREDICTED: uncharacterized protein C18orf63 homolog [Tinamus guttatus]|uniref:uncharacterized protein C18orf63 homolog n=1 Tax=Tinamus guttatus TaxID=94827 RepID=UPI00052F3695|nr:PREDICTED: uncharacterized protein C18orf63 homolog [Tinamus guttatus]
MNDTRHQSLFFVSLPELEKLCAITVTLSPQLAESEIRNAQIKICRQLLFMHQDILSAPVIGTLNQISVVMAIAFFKTGVCQAYIVKQGATLEAPQTVTPAVLQTCLSYTLIARLAPRWNKAGHLLVQGKDFLSHSGRQNAVVMDLSVSETQLCISVEACSVRLPPPELGEFDISENILKIFDSNENTVVDRHSILSNWCYVLPSMKMGQVISISHTIPPESPFHTYKDFQMHWKNLYGYILPENSEETKTYCSVYFKPIGERLFTYPLSCIRSQPVQYFPRVDLESVLNSFVSDMRSNLPCLCGFPVKMTTKALYATQELSRALVREIKSKRMTLAGEVVCASSLSQAPPRKETFPSSLRSMENSHWMEHLINEPKTRISLSISKGVGKVSTEAVQKSVSNRQMPGVSDLQVHSPKSLERPQSSAVGSPPKTVNKIIPIFKGKLMQMNGKNTRQTDGKKKEFSERQSVKIMDTSSSVLTACKSSITQVYKPIQNVSVKNPTPSSALQTVTEKTYLKRGISVFQWKRESGRQTTKSDYSDSSPSGGNSSKVIHSKKNSPSLPKNAMSVVQKSNISGSVSTCAALTSSTKKGKKFTSQSTTQVLEKQRNSQKVQLQIGKLDTEMTNSGLSQRQTKRSNEGAGLNIHESISHDAMCTEKNEEHQNSSRYKDCLAKAAGRSKVSNEQIFTGNEHLKCEMSTSKQTYSMKGSNVEAPVKKDCVKRRQKEEGSSKLKKAKRSSQGGMNMFEAALGFMSLLSIFHIVGTCLCMKN